MSPTERPSTPAQIEAEMLRLLDLAGENQQQAAARFCSEHPAWADELRLMMNARASRPPWRASAASTQARLERLATWAPRVAARYTLRGEVARGGMGAILRAWDEDLGRPLAMKVVLGKDDANSATPSVDAHVLDRFLDEAQITGQLDHPGVVPVHEVGVDSQGRVFFTMRLVKGKTAAEVFQLAHAGAEGWTLTRALEVILKVCDTLAFAHSKGVIHRDLKPSNVMVGRFGEVYVLDWGLAKVIGSDDRHDLRIRPQTESSASRVRTVRSAEVAFDPESPLVTMDGAIVGTPCYMSPEQARGDVHHIGVRSDVYAIGAMLYTLLAGAPPYMERGQQASPYAILRWVIDGRPKPLPRVRKEMRTLVGVCERAMARAPEARYADTAELAKALRAYLDQAIARGYRKGWVKMGAALLLAFLAALQSSRAHRAESKVRGLAGQVRHLRAQPPTYIRPNPKVAVPGGPRERVLVLPNQEVDELLARLPSLQHRLDSADAEMLGRLRTRLQKK